MPSDYLTTGLLASEAGLNIETVRFYERTGLLDKPQRTPAGYRQYPRAEIARLRFIKRAQQLGFSLQEIHELLSLRASPRRGSAQVKRLAEHKLTIIDDKIRDLQRMRAALAPLCDACDGHGTVEDCPIITAIEEN